MMHFISQNALPLPTMRAKPLACFKSPYLNLLSALGYAENNLPYAQLLAQYHHLNGNYLIVSPVHWQASHNDVVIVAEGDDLALTDHEARRYFDLLEAYFKEEGVQLYWHDASTWLLQINSVPNLTAPAVTRLLNQSLMPVMAYLDSSHYWQRILTEIQMLLARFNFAASTSVMLINGVWIWGGGVLLAKHLCAIKTDDTNLLPLLSLLTDKASLYDGLENIKDNDCVLLMNPGDANWRELHRQRCQMPIAYYGAEQAYVSPKLSILDRLFKRY